MGMGISSRLLAALLSGTILTALTPQVTVAESTTASAPIFDGSGTLLGAPLVDGPGYLFPDPVPLQIGSYEPVSRSGWLKTPMHEAFTWMQISDKAVQAALHHDRVSAHWATFTKLRANRAENRSSDLIGEVYRKGGDWWVLLDDLAANMDPAQSLHDMALRQNLSSALASRAMKEKLLATTAASSAMQSSSILAAAASADLTARGWFGTLLALDRISAEINVPENSQAGLLELAASRLPLLISDELEALNIPVLTTPDRRRLASAIPGVLTSPPNPSSTSLNTDKEDESVYGLVDITLTGSKERLEAIAKQLPLSTRSTILRSTTLPSRPHSTVKSLQPILSTSKSLKIKDEYISIITGDSSALTWLFTSHSLPNSARTENSSFAAAGVLLAAKMQIFPGDTLELFGVDNSEPVTESPTPSPYPVPSKPSLTKNPVSPLSLPSMASKLTPPSTPPVKANSSTDLSTYSEKSNKGASLEAPLTPKPTNTWVELQITELHADRTGLGEIVVDEERFNSLLGNRAVEHHLVVDVPTSSEGARVLAALRIAAESLGVTISSNSISPDAPLFADIKNAGGEIGSLSYTTTKNSSINLSAEFKNTNLSNITYPILGRVYCSTAMAPQLGGALMHLAVLGYSSQIARSEFAGCYNPRLIGNSDRPSFHARGLAVDLSVPENLQGSYGNLDPRLVSIFKSWGFRWGGDWVALDPMHFELAALLR
jgi:hypothetical protein